MLTLGLILCGQVLGQNTARGRVVLDSNGKQSGIVGVPVFITETGEQTKTDTGGYFSFSTSGKNKLTLVAKFASGDTSIFLYETLGNAFPVLVKSAEQMRAIRIKVEKAGTQIQSHGIRKIEVLNEGEFKKAACCTLSESFETNNTVEVSNADGVSGIRQVEMLGLAGKYVLMTRDNMPFIRGLNVLTGLSHIPGPMVGGVHIAKGAGSVTNGYEGITGGLNYALKTDPKDPRVFINGYVNSQARSEGNLILKQNLNKRTFNHLYLHYGNQFLAFDKGKDGFSDLPIYNRISVGDQLNFFGDKLEGQFGITHVQEKREGGDIRNFNGSNESGLFKFNMQEDHTEAFGKVGIFLNKSGTKSFGNIFYYNRTKSSANLNNLLGRTYDGTQNTWSYTGLYGSPDSEKWSIKAGVNMLLDLVEENYNDSFKSQYSPERKELDAGGFGELVFKNEKISAVFGARVDWNNLYGILFTPRFHFKYEISQQQQVHFQMGLGRRTPWIFAENLPLFISNRALIVPSMDSSSAGVKRAYNLPQEVAWNGGGSYTWHMNFLRFPSTFSVDAFYTYFLNQMVADRDSDPSKIVLENKSGNFTYLAQAEWMFKLHRRLDVKMSYRYVNSQMYFGIVRRLQTQQSPHRALLVVNYSTRNKWLFDLITQVNSPKRLPVTSTLPELAQMPSQGPWYTILNFQVRKEIKSWEFYTGCENILNVFQTNPVLNYTGPGRQYFDAGFAWGPTMGRNFVFGFRYSFK